MPKVSIIVPFNNVEPYIEECLNSIVNQTLDDIEIICIDDASTDNSRLIAEDFAKKDNRIKIINIEERKGQGYARNRALEIASGEYIGFVDSDDKIEPDMFLELYNAAKQNDNDITICQAREYDDINDKFILSDYYSLSLLEKMGNKVFAPVEIKEELLDINVVLWNKIYKRAYLEEIGEKFPEGFIYEDLPFFFATFLPAKRVQIVWKNFYIYRINRKNSTMQQFNNKILDRLPMVSLTYEILKKFEFLNDMSNRIKGWIINDLFHRYTLLKESFQKEYFFRMKKIFENLEITDIENPYWKKVYHFKGYLLVINNSFEDFNQKVFTKYLDIHEIENRLRSELCSVEDIDNKISNIYSDIGKTYDYTNKISQDIRFENQESLKDTVNIIGEQISSTASDIENYIKTESGFIISQTDEKISKVYEEITRNYEYTNSIRDNLSSKVDGDIQQLYEKVNYINVLTDEKINNLYKDVNGEISNIYTKTAQEFETVNNLIANNSDVINEKIKKEKEQIIEEIFVRIEKERQALTERQDKNNDIIQQEIQNQIVLLRTEYQNKLAEIESDFSGQMNLQKTYYENKINELNLKINYLSKNPVKKLIDKLKKKR